MTTFYAFADSVGYGKRIQLASGDDLTVGTGVHVASYDSKGIEATDSGHIVLVAGSVAGDWAGVSVGTGFEDSGNAVHVAQGGTVMGSGYGIYMNGVGGTVTNAGTVIGGLTGISVVAKGLTTITNTGTISAQNGIGVTSYANDGSADVTRIVNHGTITGTGAAVSGGWDSDRFLNRGQVHGDVWLSDGNDLYDGRGGTVDGTIYGNDGDDRFIPGLGEEVVEGGWMGTDTLDFRGSAGLRVSLLDDSGTGAAAGDTYAGIEVVMGSRSGADTIIGDHAGTTLMGFGGVDVLRANGGADRLMGGDEADRLWGGTGDDVFVLQSADQGGDRIADWGQVAGNDDRFELAVSGFGAGLQAGALAASRFAFRATDNRAQDADDRFVFRDSDDTLWFDADGNGAGAAVLLADLQTGAVVTASDIWLA